MIHIEKIAEVKNGLPANPKEAHVPGEYQNENFSLPIEYWIEGTLLNKITVGQRVKVLRENRNGIKMDGYFVTTNVTEVTATQFKTQNSVYNYHYV
jgi:hypothetical protein